MRGENQADKADILFEVVELSEVVQESFSFFSGIAPAYAVIVVNVYNALSHHIETYCELLSHSDFRVRREASRILRHFIEFADYSVPFVRDQIVQENDIYVLRELVRTYGDVAQYFLKISPDVDYEDNRKLLLRFLTNENDAIVQAEAALAYTKLTNYQRFNPPYDPENLPDNLLTILLEASHHSMQHKDDESLHDTYRYNLASGANRRQRYISEIIKYGVGQINKLLAMSDVSPFDTHMILRTLLDLHFRRLDRTGLHSKYELFKVTEQPSDLDGIHYGYPERIKYWRPIQPGDSLNPNQKSALRTVLDNDRFWEYPTNLFSFFYGLPDDREELRKLVERL
ncbi:MAG: hypothetical protein AAGK74_14330 [Chloroflexota bacterium]